MSTAAELRQILKEDKAGKNLYDHLTETLMKLLIDKPTNAYDQVIYSRTFINHIYSGQLVDEFLLLHFTSSCSLSLYQLTRS